MGNADSKRRRLKRQNLDKLRQMVPNMNVEEIKDVYEDYLRHTRGKRELKRKDFIKVYEKAFGKSAASLAEHIFNSFDADGNGSVSFEEFLVGISLTDNNTTDRDGRLSRVKWAFSVYDIDKSGTIDRKEMRSLVKSVFELSTASDPMLNKSPKEFADELFDEVDVNHDGEITFEEFCEAADKNEKLIDILMPAPH